ncbi:cytochrome b [Pseudomonas sp. nanlin1]|uniref:cytochrome b n=1 Tax=Pseudomonas sp. nanlin1 TaxID=3040605 RepID=UPI0038911744
MTWKNTEARYGSLSITLHWLMLVMLAAVYACIELRGQFARGSDSRLLIVQLHFMLGLSVFALVWLRLLARSLGVTPKIEPTPALWQRLGASAMHWALYALMIAMPVLGWLILSGEGKPVPFWGLQLPHLIAPNRELAAQIQDWHISVGTWGYWLIGLHAVAGLFHHYVIRDNTLRRILPGPAPERH